MKGSPPRTISGLLINNEWHPNPEAISNNLATYFQNITINQNSPTSLNQIHSNDFNSTDNKNYNLPFTLTEFNFSLRKAKNTAPGPDKLNTQLIKHLPTNYKKIILDYINHLWITDSFPSQWLNSIIIPIHKPGKPRNQPNSYRPISLTSQLCKIMERMVKGRLEWILETKNHLSPNQFGFRKHRSALEYLALLDTDINQSFHKNSHLLAISLDIHKAFDTTNTQIILNQLKKMELWGHLPKYIANFLQPRWFRVKTNNYFSKEYKFELGVPQGSILSPTLFLLAIQTIEDYIPRNTSIKLFADDIIIYNSSTENSSITNSMQSTLDKIAVWSSKTGFTFSPSKSTSIHFCKKRNCPKINILTLSNIPIPMKNHISILGLILDSRLNWKNHIEHLKSKTTRDLSIMRQLAHTSWGSDFPSLMKIYKSTILSKINYGDFIYDAASPLAKRPLDVIQNQALRLSTGAYRTSPIPSLQCIASTLPLSLQRQKSLMQFYSTALFRTHIKQTLKLHQIHSKTFTPNSIQTRIKNFLSTHESFFISPDSHKFPLLPPWSSPTPNLDLSLTKYNKESTSTLQFKSSFNQLIHDKYQNYSYYYTDGAKSKSGAGSSVITTNTILKYKLNSISSILTAELQAIREAIKLAIKTEHNKNILIITDSLSSLNSIKSSKTSIPLVLEIMDFIHISNIRDKNLILLWSPGHVNIRGNELADINAKRAISTGNIINTILSPTDLKNHFKNLIGNMFQLSWDLQEENKLWESKSSVYPPFHLPNLTRKENIIWRRISIGHTNLTHQYLLKGDPPPICQRCQTTLTIKHILTQEYHTQRSKHNLLKPLHKIVAPNTENIKELIEFLKDTDLYNKI